MATRKLTPKNKTSLQKLGKKIEYIILVDMGYSSLDAFWVENSDYVAKPTLYQICQGKRDMKLSTLLNLSTALDLPLDELVSDL